MKRIINLLLIVVLAIIMTACGTEEGADETSSEEIITVNHELDTTDVPKNPETVIVFDYGIVDTLDKLDIDIAGVSKTNIPPYLEKYEGDEYENIGSLKEPDFEKISEIDPDIIIISGRQAEVYDQLSELAPTIHLGVDFTNYFESFKENMTVVGEIFDKEEQVNEELESIEQSIEELQEVATDNGKEALIVLANDDKISAYGPSSRFGIIHDLFGIPAVDEGIEASTHGMNVSFEYVLEKDPDLLYVIDRGAAIGEESAAHIIIENKLMQDATAYPDDIYYLDSNYWYLSGGGLVSVEEMIKEINDSLH